MWRKFAQVQKSEISTSNIIQIQFLKTRIKKSVFEVENVHFFTSVLTDLESAL